MIKMSDVKGHKVYSYFLGCLTPNRYPGIEATTKKVLKYFGVDLIEMEGASCCPAPGVFGSFDLVNWCTIAARNITIAEQTGTDITMTCNGCYGSLQEANHLLHENKQLRERVNNVLKKINREWKGTIKVKHVLAKLLFSWQVFFQDIRARKHLLQYRSFFFMYYIISSKRTIPQHSP